MLVLDSGLLIAEGEPSDIVRRPEVIKACLGERYVEQHACREFPGEEPAVEHEPREP